MTSKQKRKPGEGQGEEAASAASLDRLYMAHQVHTLANLVLSRVAGTAPPASFAGQTRAPWIERSAPRPMATVVPPRPLFYWYP